MNSDFANDECIVRDPTRALIRIIIVSSYTVRLAVPNVCVSGRRVELAWSEEFHISVIEAIEG